MKLENLKREQSLEKTEAILKLIKGLSYSDAMDILKRTIRRLAIISEVT